MKQVIEPAVSGLLQTAQTYLSPQELKIQGSEISENSASPTHQTRNELHAIYLKRLASNVPEKSQERQKSFRDLIDALEPCQGAIGSLEKVMSETNFEQLLVSAPAYFDTEMPSHSDVLKTHFEKLHATFEDCLILYLTAKSFMPFQSQMNFYSNISRLLAKKDYYYQDAPIKNAGLPVDALDYGLLVLPYNSPSFLPYFQNGVSQIMMEYHLQSTKAAVQNYNVKPGVKDADIEVAIELFLKQFSLLLKVCMQYRVLPEMQVLQQVCNDYLKSFEVLELFKKSFKFKLKYCKHDPELLKNTCEYFWLLMNTWGQCAVLNVKEALGEFNKCLAKTVSRNPFYVIAKDRTVGLLLQFEKNETRSADASQVYPDIQQLILENQKRFVQLLTIAQDLDAPFVKILQKQISEEMSVILNSLLAAVEGTLGNAPCAFSILGLGSCSREEMSLCSDIDFAILISEESYREHGADLRVRPTHDC